MQFVSRITQMIAANGISVRLAAGVPTHVPQALAALAVAKGAEPFGEEPAPVAPADNGASVEEVVAAIRALMEAGESGAFGTTGEPKLNALKKKVGKNVTDAVRDAAWAQVKNEE